MMEVQIRELASLHPCFAMGKPNNKGRIHLPVSPGCNIECLFCERSINTTEKRPGVTGQVIEPQEAVEVVRRALALAPELTVAGIAGPGDTLATPYALQTFRLLRQEFPQLIKCMSTNGLLLVEKAEEVLDVGIETLTVTVNAVDPAIQAQIVGRISYHGKVYRGEEAARILIENQLAGIRRVAAAGTTVKVNTVLIPGINEHHVADVAGAVKQAGASIYNIIPLIPQHRLAWCGAPTCAQIDGARSEAEKHLPVFRHCQHCRADAIGVPGQKEYAEQIYKTRVDAQNTFSHG